MSSKPVRRLSRHEHTLWLFFGVGSGMILLLGLPLGVVLWRATQADPIIHLGDPLAVQALTLSLGTSTLALLLAVGFGTPLAYLLAGNAFRGQAWLETLLDIPMVLPPSVAGLALLLTFGRQGLVGRLLGSIGVSLPFTTTAVVVAQLFVAAPLYIRAARIGFASIDPQMEEAALTEGANQWQLFRLVMLPLSGRALLSGAVLSWARAVGEFGATLMFAGNLPGSTQTMPLVIYLGLERDLGIALVLAALLVVVSAVALQLLRMLENGAVG